VVVNGQAGKAPLTIDAVVGAPLTLDASGTKDPDGDALSYSWFFYPEAGTGIPGRPVVTRVRRPPDAEAGAGGIPSAGPGGPREPPPRVVIERGAEIKATVTPRVAGIAHVILAVTDAGAPGLTSYRRVIVNISPAPVR
jgi:hypothetical protein